jgi:glycosyltransferase involved in cell wall biosynthesis
MTNSNAELMDLLERYCLKNNIFLLGSIPNVEETFSVLDVSVLLSNSAEGFPNAVAEAMSCERYCIASDSGGAREVAGSECVIVPPNDTGAVQAAIVAAKKLPKEQRAKLGCLARQRIVQKFSLTGMRDGYVNTWQNLLR